MMKTTALFVGRFQPLHRGHVRAIRELLKRYRCVIVLVGSTNKRDQENPFSFSERRRMFERVFKNQQRLRIRGMSDVDNDPVWTRNVARIRFDVVVSGNPHVLRCLEKFPHEKLKFYQAKSYNATNIRKLLKEKNRRWRTLVPKQIAPLVEKGFYKK